ncbi:MAG: DUF563 domain-containing protein [Selenomonadaceae bacterium]|nr:DUF563 domain-containing protein [Selenomonadaceae bacterium]
MEVDINSLYPITKPLKFAQIILPDESYFNDESTDRRFFSNEYRETIEPLRIFAQKNFTSLEEKKYYFFRGSPYSIGEERLAEYFQTKGYKIVGGHNMTFEEQLNVTANCESFASTNGSCSMNMIFLKDGTETIILPRTNWLDNYQKSVNTLHNKDIKYIDSQLSIFHNKNGGPFCFIISEQLKKFFGDEWTGEYEDGDFINFLNYIKFANMKNLKPTDNYFEYFQNIYTDFIKQLMKREDLMRKVGIVIK